MHKIMKSSTTKTIVVCLTADNISEHEIDLNLFEDPYIEAATRAIESNRRNEAAIIRPITQCWDKTTPKKIEMVNSYWILLNAARHTMAEILRDKFRMQHKIDLAKEPLHGRRNTK